MRRIVTGGSVLAALMFAYAVNPVFAWAALTATGVLLTVKRARQPVPQSSDR